jgi:hypothetical protein
MFIVLLLLEKLEWRRLFPDLEASCVGANVSVVEGVSPADLNSYGLHAGREALGPSEGVRSVYVPLRESIACYVRLDPDVGSDRPDEAGVRTTRGRAECNDNAACGAGWHADGESGIGDVDNCLRREDERIGCRPHDAPNHRPALSG